MSEQLKPCPFCGDAPILGPITRGKLPLGFVVSCEKAACHVNPSTNDFDTPAEAVSKWNTRAADPVREQLVQALKEAKEFIEDLQFPDAEWSRALDKCVAAIAAEKALHG